MANVNINAAEIASTRYNEQPSDVSTPAAGYWSFYFKSDGPYAIDENGVVYGPLAAQGWIAVDETWTYASADDPTYTFTVPTDLTTKYYAGMRIKLTQSTGGTKYFIITKAAYGAPNTTITVYGGTDYNLENETITAPFYSMAKAPAAFPLDPTKWTVEITDTTNRSQASPGSGTWYNLGSMAITIPIGAWRTSYQVCLAVDDTNIVTIRVSSTLSTANNSESDKDLSAYQGITAQREASTVQASINTIYREKFLILTSKTVYYLNASSATSTADNIYFLNASSKMIIRAVCAYL